MAVDPTAYLQHCEMPEGRNSFRCVCGIFYRLKDGHTDRKFCPACTTTANAIIANQKRVYAQTRAADIISDTLGKKTRRGQKDAATLSTNAALQKVGKNLQRILKTDTPEEAFGQVVSDVAVEILGINPDIPGQTGAKPHLKLQVATMLMNFMQQVETLTAAKTLDLANLDEEDLFLLLRPVAMEMLKSDRGFLIECLRAANMQVITDDGDLRGSGEVLEVDDATREEDDLGYPGGEGAESRQRDDGEEAGWPEDVPSDDPAGTDLEGDRP